MQDNPLTDKAALITGGARRIGREITRRLHAEGMRVMIHYRSSEEDALTLQSELNAARPGSAALVQGDIMKTDTSDDILLETVHAFGRLDALINNASTFYPTPLGDATRDQWEELMGTNLRAPFFLAQAAASALQKHHGCIVNIADIHGLQPLKAHPIYCSAKAGLIMLTRALARELAPSVRVNAVAPGFIAGDWLEQGLGPAYAAIKKAMEEKSPLHRVCTPEDVAEAILGIVTGSDLVTGHVLPVEGGMLISA